MEKKLIILDRDGVINYDSKEYVKSADEWHPLPGSLQAIRLLKNKGFFVAVATNQSGIARHLFTEKDLHNMHKKMQFLLETVNAKIDFIAFCPHHPNDNCKCRKPRPGLIEQILNQFNIHPSEAIMIGDSLKDLEAAERAGCEHRLVLTGNGQKTFQTKSKLISPENTYKNLLHFTENLLKETENAIDI